MWKEEKIQQYTMQWYPNTQIAFLKEAINKQKSVNILDIILRKEERGGGHSWPIQGA